MCIYENGRVSLLFPAKDLKSYLNLCFTSHSSQPTVHFSFPLFSSTYKCPLPQPLSLHILTNAGGYGVYFQFPSTLFTESVLQPFRNQALPIFF